MRLRRIALFLPALGLAVVLLIATQVRAQQPTGSAGSGSAAGSATEAPAKPEAPAPVKGPRPQKVHVGMYLKAIPWIDLKSNTYLVDLYLWFRWNGDLDPTKNFELTNAVQSWDLLKTPLYETPDILEDGSKYQVFHVHGNFAHAFPLHQYPFDSQEIVVELEDSEYQTSELVYIDDTNNSGVHPSITIPGWEIGKHEVLTSDAKYGTNFGDPRVQSGGDVYSHYAFVLHVTRPTVGYLIKTVLPIAIVILITFVVFFIDSKYFEGRLGLAITSLISAVALQLTAGADLPSVGYMVLLDRIYNLSYAVILLTLLESVIAVRLTDAGKEAQAKKLDKISLVVLAVVFFGGLAATVLFR